MHSTVKFLVAISLISSIWCGASRGEDLFLHVGDVHKVEIADWKVDDPAIARIYKRNLVVGLKEGSTKLSGPSQIELTVARTEPALMDPGLLEQYEDNRVFRVDGRRCVGSVLNGQRAVDPAERENTESNRVINPKPLAPDRPLEWEVEPSAEVLDGAGVLMGTVAPKLRRPDGTRVPSSKFNFGMSKVIGGRLCLYAFATPIIPGEKIARLVDPKELEDGAVGTSAWLPIDRVIDKDALIERIGLGKPKLPALPLADEKYLITGGDPKMYVGEFGEMAIVKTVKENNAVPSHYLRRPSGTVNIIYSVPGFGLGGQGLDSFLVTGNAIFRPAKGAKVFVQPTYFPIKHPRVGEVSPMTMTFIYGAVEAEGTAPVYGWVAKEALSEKR